MKVKEICEVLDGTFLYGDDISEAEVERVCACDLMSDVLAFSVPDSVLLTGLISPQSIRTADIAEIKAIVYIRGKKPGEDTLELARERRIPVVLTDLSLFEACGKLYSRGLKPVFTKGRE